MARIASQLAASSLRPPRGGRRAPHFNRPPCCRRGPSRAICALLGNMCSLGVRSLGVSCELCHHAAVLNVEPWQNVQARRKPARGSWEPRSS